MAQFGVIPSAIPVREFAKCHGGSVTAVAVFPDRRRMVTGSQDKMLRLWDLKTGVVLKKMERHSGQVKTLAVSRDGRLIASGGENGELVGWDGDTGEPLTRAINATAGRPGHFGWIISLDFSLDSAVLATCSNSPNDYATLMLWCTQTWQIRGHIKSNNPAVSVRYSPDGEHIAIATVNDIQIWKPGMRQWPANAQPEFQALLKAAATDFSTDSFAWMPDSTRLLSSGKDANNDSTIWQWDLSTSKRVGDPWEGHSKGIRAIALNSNGTLAASASGDNYIYLWQLSDRQIIAIFRHTSEVHCIAFCTDGRHILSGGADKKISQWPVPMTALPQDDPTEHPTHPAENSDFKILVISVTARDSCVTGDLPTAEEFLTKDINADANNYNLYANRAFVKARRLHWDEALSDAVKSVSIQPSLNGYISKGIALCGKQQVRAARTAFDVASVFAQENSKTAHHLLLISAIALFNAGEHQEALLLIEELVAACPNADPLACRIVEAHLYVQLGTIALENTHYNEAVNHFTTAVNASAAFSNSAIHLMYEDLGMLFGWDLKSLWQTTIRQQCHALLLSGRLGEGLESYRSIMGMSDETTKGTLLAWFAAIKQK